MSALTSIIWLAYTHVSSPPAQYTALGALTPIILVSPGNAFYYYQIVLDINDPRFPANTFKQNNPDSSQHLWLSTTPPLLGMSPIENIWAIHTCLENILSGFL